MNKQWTLGELAQRLGAELVGDETCVIVGLNTLKEALHNQLSFLANSAYRSQLPESRAGAVIVSPADAPLAPGNKLVAANPYLCFAMASQLFDDRPVLAPTIHPTAIVADSAVLGNNVAVGPRAVIGEHCHIADNCEIGAGTIIGDHSVLGEGCLLHANVTLYHNVQLGARVRVHSGAVLGSDGFGFAPTAGRWHKIAQLGGVRIGNDVEIGANTCIDRGALGDTVIGDNVIIDNLVQIAHNVQVGSGTAMAACVGIAGSTRIGKHCILAGGAGVAGHLEITDGVQLMGMAMVTGSITEAGAYASGTSHLPLKEWRRAVARFRQLDPMAKRLQQLEKDAEGTSND